AFLLCADSRHLDRLFLTDLFLDHASFRKVNTLHDLTRKYCWVVIASNYQVCQCSLVESPGERVVDEYQCPGYLHFEFDDRCSASRDQCRLHILIYGCSTFCVNTIHDLANYVE